MPVIYNSKKLIPAPRVSITKEINRTQGGDLVTPLYRISVNGTLLPDRGSPTSSGTFWTNTGYPPNETPTSNEMLKSLLKKQEAIRGLFATEGLVFEIQPWDGTTSASCNPRVTGLEFTSQDQMAWFNRCDFTINLEADVMYGPLFPEGETVNTYFVSDIEENWQMELNEQPANIDGVVTYRLSHTVSAVGRKTYSVDGQPTSAWERARDWVQDRIGFDSQIMSSSGALNVPNGYAGYNHVRSESVDKTGGRYGINENWLVSNDTVLEDFTVDVRESIEEGLTSVSLQGTVTGLESRDANYQITETKWTAASGRFNTIEGQLLTRAQTYGGVSLNPNFKVFAKTKNPTTGIITYSVEYDNRPSNCITGARLESIQVTDNYPSDVFASIPVIGRAAGPVLQDINTVTESSRTLAIECVMESTGGCNYASMSGGKPNVTTLINNIKPVADQVFKKEDQETWSPKNGRYSRTITWVYQ